MLLLSLRIGKRHFCAQFPACRHWQIVLRWKVYSIDLDPGLGCAIASRIRRSLPSSREVLVSSAFCGCLSLQSVGFSPDVKRRWIGCFARLSGHVVASGLPASVEIICYRGFRCPSLSDLTLADNSQLRFIRGIDFSELALAAI
jgi:hypothetical protein